MVHIIDVPIKYHSWAHVDALNLQVQYIKYNMSVWKYSTTYISGSALFF